MGNLRRESLELYLVTDRALSLGRSLREIVAAAVQGGVTMVQLREKECDTREFVELGRTLHDLLRPARIPLIINDRADIAQVIGAEGLHIGQHDMDYADAPPRGGAGAIIGLSIEKATQARERTNIRPAKVGHTTAWTTSEPARSLRHRPRPTPPKPWDWPA